MQVLEQNLKDVELMMWEIKESLPIFFTKMAPSHFLEMGNIDSKMPLRSVCDKVVLCVSAIGFANAFVQAIERVLTFPSLTFVFLMSSWRFWEIFIYMLCSGPDDIQRCQTLGFSIYLSIPLCSWGPHWPS